MTTHTEHGMKKKVVYLPLDLILKLRAENERSGVRESAIIRRALTEHFNNKKGSSKNLSKYFGIWADSPEDVKRMKQEMKRSRKHSRMREIRF